MSVPTFTVRILTDNVVLHGKPLPPGTRFPGFSGADVSRLLDAKAVEVAPEDRERWGDWLVDRFLQAHEQLTDWARQKRCESACRDVRRTPRGLYIVPYDRS
jgi:hypothetical protein